MISYSKEDIRKLDKIFRINLINSCSGYKSANLIGTVSKKGIENVAVFSSVTHIGSNPALLGFFLRPTTVPRNTYSNIKSTLKYTINHIHNDIIHDAHHTSAKYDALVSEFEQTKLIPEYKNGFIAPYVKHAPIQLALSYKDEYPIALNNTILVVGEIEEIHINSGLMEKDGFINLSSGNVAAINGLDGYAIPKLKNRIYR